MCVANDGRYATSSASAQRGAYQPGSTRSSPPSATMSARTVCAEPSHALAPVVTPISRHTGTNQSTPSVASQLRPSPRFASGAPNVARGVTALRQRCGKRAP